MAVGLAASTPTRRQQHLSFETASLNGSSSPPAPHPSSPRTQSNDSPRKYTFTPQRVKSFPRAWERRPATPHVPRNEAQKIRKRVPLGTITTNNHDTWRRANHPSIMRPVKRLRVSHIDQEEDKENISYLAVKWADDGIALESPKRKPRGVTALNLQEETVVQDHETKNEESSEVESDEDEDVEVMQHASASLSTHEDEYTLENTTELNDDLMGGVTLRTTLDDVKFSYEQGQDLPSQSVIRAPELEDAGQTSSKSLTLEPTSADSGLVGRQQDELQNEDETGAVMVSADPRIETASNGMGSSLSADHDETAFLHDFLSRARAQKAAKEQPDQHSQSQGSTTTIAVEAMEDVQDASAAGILDDTPSLNAVTVAASESDKADLPPEEQADVNSSSPCRRSSRLITRLPRPQKPSTTVPNNIALKRLNGTEFISQKETQSVALATRTNTKRNKGVAKSVQERLKQLDAELKAREPETGIAESDGKKRKKKLKEVTWAERLARSQDGGVVTSPRDGESEAADEQVVASESSQFNVVEAPPPESKDTVADQAKRQGRKVRKLRKLNVGTVNGTPGPKKSASLPVPVASTFYVDNCKLATVAPKKAMSEMGTSMDEATKSSKAPGKGFEKRSQTRTRTRTSRGA